MKRVRFSNICAATLLVGCGFASPAQEGCLSVIEALPAAEPAKLADRYAHVGTPLNQEFLRAERQKIGNAWSLFHSYFVPLTGVLRIEDSPSTLLGFGVGIGGNGNPPVEEDAHVWYRVSGRLNGRVDQIYLRIGFVHDRPDCIASSFFGVEGTNAPGDFSDFFLAYADSSSSALASLIVAAGGPMAALKFLSQTEVEESQ